MHLYNFFFKRRFELEILIGNINDTIFQVVPKFDDAKNVVPEEIVNISASADHRIIDGATMARFIHICKKQLESPFLLLLNK